MTTMGELLGAAVEATGSGARLRWIPDAALRAAGVEPWTELPLWAPEDEMAGHLAGRHGARAGRRAALPARWPRRSPTCAAWLRDGGEAELSDWGSHARPAPMSAEREARAAGAGRVERSGERRVVADGREVLVAGRPLARVRVASRTRSSGARSPPRGGPRAPRSRRAGSAARGARASRRGPPTRPRPRARSRPSGSAGSASYQYSNGVRGPAAPGTPPITSTVVPSSVAVAPRLVPGGTTSSVPGRRRDLVAVDRERAPRPPARRRAPRGRPAPALRLVVGLDHLAAGVGGVGVDAERGRPERLAERAPAEPVARDPLGVVDVQHGVVTCGRMPEMEPGPHVEEMEAAIRADGEGLRALLDGDEEARPRAAAEAVARYRASWELAPPRSYGRLVGMLKAAVIAGDAAEAAAYARGRSARPTPRRPHYVRAIAALVEGDDDAARAARRRACARARPRSAAPPTRSTALAARRRRRATPPRSRDRRGLRGPRRAPHRRAGRRHRADARAPRRAARPRRAPGERAAPRRLARLQLGSAACLRIASAIFVFALKAAFSARSGGEPSGGSSPSCAADLHLVEDDEVRGHLPVADRELVHAVELDRLAGRVDPAELAARVRRRSAASARTRSRPPRPRDDLHVEVGQRREQPAKYARELVLARGTSCRGSAPRRRPPRARAGRRRRGR